MAFKQDKPRKPAFSDYVHLGNMAMVEYALGLGNNKGLDPSLLKKEEDKNNQQFRSSDANVNNFGDGNLTGHDLRKPCTKHKCKKVRTYIDKLYEQRELYERKLLEARTKLMKAQQNFKTVDELRMILKTKEHQMRRDIKNEKLRAKKLQEGLENHGSDLNALREQEIQKQLELQAKKFELRAAEEALKSHLWNTYNPTSHVKNQLEPIPFAPPIKDRKDDKTVMTEKSKVSIIESKYSGLADDKLLDLMERPKTTIGVMKETNEGDDESLVSAITFGTGSDNNSRHYGRSVAQQPVTWGSMLPPRPRTTGALSRQSTKGKGKLMNNQRQSFSPVSSVRSADPAFDRRRVMNPKYLSKCQSMPALPSKLKTQKKLPNIKSKTKQIKEQSPIC